MKKIKFRKYKEEDLQFLHELLSDSETKKYFPFMYTESTEQSKLRLMTRMLLSEDDLHTLVILNKEDSPVGEISYNYSDDDKDIVELSIRIHPNHRGKGYAKTATLEYIEKIKNRLKNVKTVRLIIKESNIASKASAKSLDFKLMGHTKSNERLEQWEKEIER